MKRPTLEVADIIRCPLLKNGLKVRLLSGEALAPVRTLSPLFNSRTSAA